MNESLFPRTLSAEGHIPFLAGRPQRRHRIDEDDLANLRIALGLHHDVLELCSDPHLFVQDGP
jgi:hypothetical protein